MEAPLSFREERSAGRRSCDEVLWGFCFRLETTHGFAFHVFEDAERLAELVAEFDVGLVYFDQFLDTLGVGTDENRAKPIRDALQPLRTAAHGLDCAFLGTLHPNKRKGGSFRDRMSGTPAWNQLSRSGLLLAEHPTDSTRRVLVVPKHNYSEGAPSFEFTIKPGAFETDDGELIEQSYAADCAESNLTVEDVLAGSVGGTVTVTKADRGRAYLEERLNGREVRSKTLKPNCRNSSGLVNAKLRGWPRTWASRSDRRTSRAARTGAGSGGPLYPK
jgi:hypothetical protein